jgi:hypothetical protein
MKPYILAIGTVKYVTQQDRIYLSQNWEGMTCYKQVRTKVIYPKYSKHWLLTILKIQ